MTVSVIVAVFVSVPDVPETVTVAVPRAAALLAVSVRVLVVEVLVGAKEAVTPEGKPDADRATLPEKLPIGTTLIVLVPPVAPWTIVRLLGEALRLKPAMGVTPGQLLTKLAALTLPMPLAKSHPVLVP